MDTPERAVIRREREIVEAFVALAGTLASGYDVVDLFSRLTRICTELLDVAAAGLLLADPAGGLHVLAASSENTRHLESLQIQQREGPCLDCFATAASVSAPDLRQETSRWPRFTAAAHDAGFLSVHALPLRLSDTTLGAMGLFGSDPGTLNPEDLQLGQALADVAAIALVQARAATNQQLLIEQLQHALDSRVIIEQAKGVLAQQGGLDMEAAFAALRRYSRDHNLRLAETARAVSTRTLSAAQLLTAVSAHRAPPEVAD